MKPPRRPLQPDTPCPDPASYILVRTKSKAYWRLRRGLGGDAPLNDALKTRGRLMQAAMPAAKRLMTLLQPYAHDLALGHAQVRLGNLLIRALQEEGPTGYEPLPGFELQQEYPMAALLKMTPRISIGTQGLDIRLGLPAGGGIAVRSKLITGYRMVAILVTGNALEEGDALALQEAASGRYKPGSGPHRCRLELPLPDAAVPWMLLLKVECFEGDEPAVHPKYRAMKVVAVGGG